MFNLHVKPMCKFFCLYFIVLQGLCFRLAEEKGIGHAQLPITKYMNLKTRQVLTVNQGYLENCYISLYFNIFSTNTRHF